MVQWSADIGASIGSGASPGGLGGTEDRFELHISTVPNPLRVLEFHGTEGLSRLFSFDIVALADLEPTVLQGLALGQPATFSMFVVGRPRRVVQGIICAIETRGARHDHHTREYRFRLVPKMWFLRRRKVSRIFQDKTPIDIVSTVLRDWDVPFRWDVTRIYPVRSYCVQYCESDYDFVLRMLAEEGLFFFFEQPSGALDALTGGLATAAAGAVTAAADLVGGAVGAVASEAASALHLVETVVFADAPAAYPAIEEGLLEAMLDVGVGAAASALGSAIGGPVGAAVSSVHAPAPHVPYRALEGMHASDEFVHRFTLKRTLRTKVVTLRDYDFRRPNLQLTAQASVDSAGPQSLAAAAVASVRGSVSGSFESGPASVSLNVNLAATLGGGVMPALVDPSRLEAYDHHGEYDEPDVAKQTAAIQLEQRRARAFVAQGRGTCVRFVAGNRFTLEGHAIDEFDREWVLTKIVHRGKIPEGTAEVSERVYDNEFECVPSDVAYRPKRPARDLQQVLESATVVGPPGEEIYTDEYGRIKVQFHWDRQGRRNEDSSCWIRVAHAWAGAAWGFQFIPRIGMEVLVSFLGGDEDRPVIIGAVYNKTHPSPFPLPHAKTISGIRTQSTPGGGGFNELSFQDAAENELVYLHAQRDLLERVVNDHATNVGRDQTIVVGNTKDERIAQEHHQTIGGDDVRSVQGNLRATIGGNHYQVVQGRRSDEVHGPELASVIGSSVHNRGGRFERIDGVSSTTVGLEEEPASLNVMVYGSEAHDATKTIVLRAKDGITLECGDTSIALTPDGLRLQTKKLTGAASDTLTLFGNGPAIQLSKKADVLSDAINLYSKGGVIELDKDSARVDGPQVQLGCSPDTPPKLSDDPSKPKTKKFKWKMLDPELSPYKSKTYTLVTQGFRIKGTTDGDGAIDQDIPVDAQTVEVTLWTESYPTGPRLSYTVLLKELPPASSTYGAQLRLQNLGYYFGTTSDRTNPEFENAVRQFQLDHALDPTGKVDGTTSAKLDEVHPSA